jgi:hypothetical protein
VSGESGSVRVKGMGKWKGIPAIREGSKVS